MSRRPALWGTTDAERRRRGAAEMADWRRRHGLSQTEAADLLGLSQGAVSGIEAGKVRGASEPVRRLMELADRTADGLALLRRAAQVPMATRRQERKGS